MVATSISLPNAAIVASSASVAPLVATITGSNTIGRSGFSALSSSRSATCPAAKALPIMPILTASTPMSLDDRVDLGEDHFGRHRMDGAHAQRVLSGDRGDRGHRVAAEHGDGLDVGLDPGAAAGIRSGNDEDAEAASTVGDRPVTRASTASQISSTSRLDQPRHGRRLRP